MIVMIYNNNALIIFLLILVISLQATSGTNIKWTPATGSSSSNIAAATAPKSQRYWDEHNIERPDYTKTDVNNNTL